MDATAVPCTKFEAASSSPGQGLAARLPSQCASFIRLLFCPRVRQDPRARGCCPWSVRRRLTPACGGCDQRADKAAKGRSLRPPGRQQGEEEKGCSGCTTLQEVLDSLRSMVGLEQPSGVAFLTPWSGLIVKIGSGARRGRKGHGKSHEQCHAGGQMPFGKGRTGPASLFECVEISRERGRTGLGC